MFQFGSKSASDCCGGTDHVHAHACDLLTLHSWGHREPSGSRRGARTMNALLVYPRFPVTYWGFQYGLRLIGKRASLPPLGLITVAALLPDLWHVRLVDLNLEDLSDDDLRWSDVVLTGGLLIQVESMQDIVARARAFGVSVAVGGPAPTTSPELFGDADVVFRGEAEGRIDELVHALTQQSDGSHIVEAPESYPDMTTVPVPRYDLLNLTEYASLSVQYSRGCPFRCEFCDIIEIFGRRSRVKTPEQVIDELEERYRLGYRGPLVFVDDNFIGNKPAVKRLLPIVRDWQHKRGHPFEFYTEASVDLATDQQLLRNVSNPRGA
ncbi:MAG: radical SAM protein [Candidatus Eisenbacteria bacterium]